jgi:glucose-1-phosphate cytidylyltransferase
MRSEMFDYIREGEELVEEPFARLIEERKLGSFRHLGFWQAMETVKDKISFDRMMARGDCPWMVWNKPGNTR